MSFDSRDINDLVCYTSDEETLSKIVSEEGAKNNLLKSKDQVTVPTKKNTTNAMDTTDELNNQSGETIDSKPQTTVNGNGHHHKTERKSGEEETPQNGHFSDVGGDQAEEKHTKKRKSRKSKREKKSSEANGEGTHKKGRRKHHSNKKQKKVKSRSPSPVRSPLRERSRSRSRSRSVSRSPSPRKRVSTDTETAMVQKKNSNIQEAIDRVNQDKSKRGEDEDELLDVEYNSDINSDKREEREQVQEQRDSERDRDRERNRETSIEPSRRRLSINDDEDIIRNEKEDIHDETAVELEVSGTFLSETYGILNKIEHFRDMFRNMSISRIKSEKIRVNRNIKFFEMMLDIVRNNSYVSPHTEIERERLYEECKYFGYSDFLYQMCPSPVRKSFIHEWLTSHSKLANLTRDNESVKLAIDINSSYIGAIGFEFTVFNTTDFYLSITVTEQRRTTSFELGGSDVSRCGRNVEPKTFRVKAGPGIGLDRNLPSVLILEIRPYIYPRVPLSEVSGRVENYEINRNRHSYLNPFKNQGRPSGGFEEILRTFEKDRKTSGIGMDIGILRID